MCIRSVSCAAAWCACFWALAAGTCDAQPLIVAHRGASHLAPENTLASFRLAWQREADAIEADFYLTGDQQIVCIHDDNTERVASINLPVSQTTFAELRKLDVGSWKAARYAGLRMPTLSEVLACVPEQKQVFIEVKCGPEIVPFLHHELQVCCLTPKQTNIISFRSEVIEATKRAMPERQAYWLVSFKKDEESGQWLPNCDEIISTARRIGADGLDLAGEVEVVDRTLVDRCHALGLSVHVWTIDDLDKAKHFQQLEVDSITTNLPSALRGALYPRLPTIPVQIPESVSAPHLVPSGSIP